MVVHRDGGGQSWQTLALPLSGTSQVLSGLAFTADLQHGVVSLKHPFNQEEDVVLYSTSDGGQTWEELVIDPSILPEGYIYIQKVDSLAFENGAFRLVLGQGADKVELTATTLTGAWQYTDHWTATVHVVG